MGSARARRWCFTINNPDDETVPTLQSLVPGRVRFLVYGRERAPTTGTSHIQGYLELATSVRRTQVLSLLPGGPHVEVARGDWQQNRDYCLKEGDGEALGTPTTQGQRTDLATAAETVRLHGLKRCAEEHPTTFIKYHKGFAAYRNLVLERDTSFENRKKPYVEVHWGRTSTGKTSFVWEDAEKHGRVWWHVADKWFCGYDGHECAIFDDVPSGVPLTLFLKLLRGVPVDPESKGSRVPFCPKRVYITSNLDPRHWYPDAQPEQTDALLARFDKVKHYAYTSWENLRS